MGVHHVFKCALSVIILSGPVQAKTTLFENFPTTFNNTGTGSSSRYDFQAFVNFRPSSDVYLTEFRWLGDNYRGPTGLFEFSMFHNENIFKLPESQPIFIQRDIPYTKDEKDFTFPNGPTIALEAIYSATIENPILLEAGKNYQFSIYETSGFGFKWSSGLQSNLPGSSALIRRPDGSLSFGGPLAFGLYSDAVSPPPPPTFLPEIPTPSQPPKVLQWEGSKGFDPSKPTVVITHGWQTLQRGVPLKPQWMDDMESAIRGVASSNVNIIKVYWEDAWTGLFPTGDDLRYATAQVAFQGQWLAKGLAGLGLTSTSDLHFIGHSLGTIVNAYASNFLGSIGIDTEQFTILDRPFGKGIPTSLPVPVGGDADSIIFRTLLNQGTVEFVDNYYGTLPSGTGAPFRPEAAAFDIDVVAGHTGMQPYYIGTIGTACDLSNSGGFGCSIVGGGFNAAAERYPWDPDRLPLKRPSVGIQINTVDWLTFNCLVNTGGSAATCTEGSPAYLWMEDFTFASDAQFLAFEFAWNALGDGDWLTLHFGDILLYSGLGTGFDANVFYSSGLIPVADLAGQRGQLLFTLNSVGESSASFSIRNLVMTRAGGVVPEPATWAMLIAGFGVVGMAARRRRAGAGSVVA